MGKIENVIKIVLKISGDNKKIKLQDFLPLFCFSFSKEILVKKLTSRKKAKVRKNRLGKKTYVQNMPPKRIFNKYVPRNMEFNAVFQKGDYV